MVKIQYDNDDGITLTLGDSSIYLARSAARIFFAEIYGMSPETVNEIAKSYF